VGGFLIFGGNVDKYQVNTVLI